MSYNVHSRNFGISVELDSRPAGADSNALVLVSQASLPSLTLQSVASHDIPGLLCARDDVVVKKLAQRLLAGMLELVGNLVKGPVERHEERVLAVGAVQGVNELGKVVQQLGELAGAIIRLQGLVDGELGVLAVLRGTVWMVKALERFEGLMTDLLRSAGGGIRRGALNGLADCGYGGRDRLQRGHARPPLGFACAGSLMSRGGLVWGGRDASGTKREGNRAQLHSEQDE